MTTAREYVEQQKKLEAYRRPERFKSLMTYTTVSYSNPESGFNPVSQTVKNNKGKTISQSTYTVQPPENEQSISVPLSRVSTNPQAGTKGFYAQVQTDKRFVSNLQRTGQYDLERSQSISTQEKYNRLRAEKTDFNNNNTRNTIVDTITNKDKDKYSKRFQDKANILYDESKINFSKGTFGKNSSVPIINEINSIKGVVNRGKSYAFNTAGVFFGAGELGTAATFGTYNYFKSGSYVNLPSQTSNVIKKTPAFLVAGAYEVGKFGFNTAKYFDNKEYRSKANEKGFNWFKETQLYKRPGLAIGKFETEIILFDKALSTIKKVSPFKSAVVQEKEFLVPSNKKLLGLNTKAPKGEIQLKGVSYISGSTSASSISSNLPQKSGFVLNFKEKLHGINNIFRSVDTKVIVNNNKITKVQTLGKLKIKTVQNSGDDIAKVFKFEKGKWKFQSKVKPLSSGKSQYTDFLEVIKPTKTRTKLNSIFQQAETTKTYDIKQYFSNNKNIVGQITSRTKTISGTSIKQKGVSKDLVSYITQDGNFLVKKAPKILKSKLGAGRNFNIDDLYLSSSKKPSFKLDVVGNTIEKTVETPLNIIRQPELYTGFSSKTTYRGTLNIKRIPLNKQGSVSSVFGVSTPATLLDPIYKIKVNTLKPLSGASFDSNILNTLKSDSLYQTGNLKGSLALATLNQKQTSRSDVYLKNSLLSVSALDTKQRGKSIQTFDNKYIIRQAQLTGLKQKTAQKTKLGLLQIPALKLKTTLKPVQTPITTPININPVPQIPFLPTVKPPLFPKIPLFLPSNKKQKQMSFDIFDVFVKSKGKFKKVGTKSSGFDAFNLGASIVDKTASASFKISQRGKPNNFNINFGLNSMFRTSKSDKNVFVEKRKYRLNTKGEKNQITYIATRNNFLRGLLK